MDEKDDLSEWRLHSSHRVVDAALLIAGHNPSGHSDLRCNHHSHSMFDISSYDTPIDFDASFDALTADIRDGRLKAKLFYVRGSVETGFTTHWEENDCVGFERPATLAGDPRSANVTRSKKLPPFEEPHWGHTRVDVGDLKSWLRSRRTTTGFYFPNETVPEDEVLNPAHDHFAPELALAVTGWKALMNVNPAPRTSRAVIEEWLEKNPEAWKGKKEISAKAIDRVATLINWNPQGGLPKASGGT